MKRNKIAIVHASRAALEPVFRYYAEQAPELEVVNLLDDGVMGLLAHGEGDRAVRRLVELITIGREEYGARLALLTCSAVTGNAMKQVREQTGIPVIKIDEPMAKLAVRAGTRIGVLATFPATVTVTRDLIETAAAEAGTPVEVTTILAAEALEALLDGKTAEHDARFLQAVAELGARNVDAVVLAQVSMARLAEQARELLKVPVFHSLESSVAVVRHLMAEAGHE